MLFVFDNLKVRAIGVSNFGRSDLEVKMMNFVLNNDEFCIINDEFCVKNDEF